MPLIKSPGKFEGEHSLTSRLYRLSPKGTTEVIGSIDEYGWVAMVFPKLPLGWAAILIEYNYGFVEGTYYRRTEREQFQADVANLHHEEERTNE